MRAYGSAWNAEDVQSSGGGVVIAPGGQQLYTYVSGRNQRMQKLQTGMLSLRRDGRGIGCLYKQITVGQTVAYMLSMF